VLDVYRKLAPKEKALVWAVVLVGVVWVFGSGGIVAGAQVAAALGTLALAALAFRQVEELRKTRIAQERPQVIVDLEYRSQLAYITVRNIGRGAAKDVTFDFSAPLEIPDGASVNELPYFTKGIDYLAPGAEISTWWDSMITLIPFLEDRGMHDGITITSRYKSLTGEPHKTPWTINPLLMKDKTAIPDDMHDLAHAVKELQKDIHKVVGVGHTGLQVSTSTERKERAARRGREGDRPRKEQDDG
jgi:hypothetical protein